MRKKWQEWREKGSGFLDNVGTNVGTLLSPRSRRDSERGETVTRGRSATMPVIVPPQPDQKEKEEKKIVIESKGIYTQEEIKRIQEITGREEIERNERIKREKEGREEREESVSASSENKENPTPPDSPVIETGERPGQEKSNEENEASAAPEQTIQTITKRRPPPLPPRDYTSKIKGQNGAGVSLGGI